MMSKKVLYIAAALLVVASTSAMAASVTLNNFNVAQLSIGPIDYLNLNSTASYGIVSGTMITPNPTPYSTIYNYVKNGYAGGAWNGVGGINSSVAAANPLHVTALAVAKGEVLINDLGITTFYGHTIKTADSLIRYTYYGDANFDGVVDYSDYAMIDFAYQNGGPAAGYFGWVWGDFNYDGAIDEIDLANFNYVDSLHLPPIGTVPEPTALVLLVAGAISLVFIRRRR
jgi:hypothetical protein